MLHVPLWLMQKIVKQLHAFSILDVNVLVFGEARGVMLYDLLSGDTPFTSILLKPTNVGVLV
jgi:hypothetical protein